MYGRWAARLGGGIQLSSSLPECDPALLSASEIYSGAAGLACGKQMVASCSSSFFYFFVFSFSHCSFAYQCWFCKATTLLLPQRKHTSLILSTNPRTCFGLSPTHHSNFSLLNLQLPSALSSVNPLNGRCPVLPVHCTLQTHTHMHTLNNLPVNHSTLFWRHQKNLQDPMQLGSEWVRCPNIYHDHIWHRLNETNCTVSLQSYVDQRLLPYFSICYIILPLRSGSKLLSAKVKNQWSHLIKHVIWACILTCACTCLHALFKLWGSQRWLWSPRKSFTNPGSNKRWNEGCKCAN